MKITLIFPPHWAPYQPYLSLPVLTALLRREGHSVTQRDINIECVDYFTSTAVQRDMFRKIMARLKYLRTLQNRSEEEELEMTCLSRWEGSEDIIRQARVSKEIMRDSNRFFDFDLYKLSSCALLEAYHIFGDAYFPTLLDFYYLRQKYSAYSTKGIIDAMNDPENNLYYEYFQKVTIPSLKVEQSDFYGISISGFTQMIPAMTLASMIKKNFPEAHICIGGNVVTRVGTRLLPSSPLFDFFDSIILYEGEVAIVELLKALEKNKTLESVPNIIYKNKDGKLIFNETITTPDINLLPAPDFQGLPLDKYFSPFKIASILSARGCYWNKCAFCQHRYTYRGKYRPRDIKLVIDDIESMSREGFKYFSFCDEAIPPKRLEDIARGILDRKLDIIWEAYARVDKSLDLPLAKLLFSAGCRMLSFGLESASPRLLELMSKGHNIEDFQEVLGYTSEAGIWNYAWFFTGFPSETEEEARLTVDFILRNQTKVHSATPNAVFGLEEYTDIVKNPDKYFLKEIKPIEGQDLAFVYDYTVKSGLSPEEARKLSNELCIKLLNEHKEGAAIANLSRIHQLLYVERYGNQ
ncbi:MAG TPA: radical SAM protein [Candidatus Eremiobacteraeota bacterium]|nr:MAG: Ribosomal protein S12 methylthiotransferase RimO [bacterium ADurb.Bin363]HPZ07015.1 radical SAM protein [Candidatus Eremiobacteraeota bacterium]